ncbi:MAG: BLUF domain-containing protein [Hyphomicrobium sp.]|nr:BLUF domain-containing protein [Hyphomicrobium sp.]
MTVFQLIYASRPFGFDDLALSGILASAERNNVRDAITGSLICREDLFVQLLEGPEDKVEAAFKRIRHDDRHTDVGLVLSGATQSRLFPDWAMRHDPAQSWMWTRSEVTAGAVTKASADDVRAIFTRLAANEPAGALSCPFAVA